MLENEIELKIMVLPERIPVIENWLNTQTVCLSDTQILGNTYYDTPDFYFAQGQMGLRVRQKNQQFEITLKMKGEIVGGLHIRPEYNLALADATPDFKRLVLANNLQIADVDQIQQSLIPTFSTDFTRKIWLIDFNQSQIEVALDQGVIKNQRGQEAICEIEFELKQGNLADIFLFLEAMPKADGMWLSSLSKAQRGYLVGYPEKIAKECEKLTACHLAALSEKDKYQYEQQLADFIRLDEENRYPKLVELYTQIAESPVQKHLRAYLMSADYLNHHLKILERDY